MKWLLATVLALALAAPGPALAEGAPPSAVAEPLPAAGLDHAKEGGLGRLIGIITVGAITIPIALNALEAFKYRQLCAEAMGCRGMLEELLDGNWKVPVHKCQCCQLREIGGFLKAMDGKVDFDMTDVNLSRFKRLEMLRDLAALMSFAHDGRFSLPGVANLMQTDVDVQAYLLHLQKVTGDVCQAAFGDAAEQFDHLLARQ